MCQGPEVGERLLHSSISQAARAAAAEWAESTGDKAGKGDGVNLVEGSIFSNFQERGQGKRSFRF